MKIYKNGSQSSKRKFAELCKAFQSLSKPEQDAFLMAQIKAMDSGSVSTSRHLKRKSDQIGRLFIIITDTETIILIC